MDYNQRIINAKRKWEEAYSRGDQEGMDAAHAEAEEARNEAKMSEVFSQIASYLQDGNTVDYNGAIDLYNDDYNSRYPDLGGLGPYQKIKQKERPKEPQNYFEQQYYDEEYPEQNYYSDKKADTADNWMYANTKPESVQNEEVWEDVKDRIGSVISWIANTFFPDPKTLKRGR